MNRFKVSQHERSAFIRISAEIMLSVKGMKETITLLKRPQKKIFERIQRLSVILQVFEKLAKSVAIYGIQYVSRPPWILVFKQPLFVTAGN